MMYCNSIFYCKVVIFIYTTHFSMDRPFHSCIHNEGDYKVLLHLSDCWGDFLCDTFWYCRPFEALCIHDEVFCRVISTCDDYCDVLGILQLDLIATKFSLLDLGILQLELVATCSIVLAIWGFCTLLWFSQPHVLLYWPLEGFCSLLW